MDLRQLEVLHLLVDLADVLVGIVEHEDVLLDLCVHEELVVQDTGIAIERFLVLLSLLELKGLVQFLVEAFVPEFLRDASGLLHSLVGLGATERQNRL